MTLGSSSLNITYRKTDFLRVLIEGGRGLIAKLFSNCGTQAMIIQCDLMGGSCSVQAIFILSDILINSNLIGY